MHVHSRSLSRMEIQVVSNNANPPPKKWNFKRRKAGFGKVKQKNSKTFLPTKKPLIIILHWMAMSWKKEIRTFGSSSRSVYFL